MCVSPHSSPCFVYQEACSIKVFVPCVLCFVEQNCLDCHCAEEKKVGARKLLINPTVWKAIDDGRLMTLAGFMHHLQVHHPDHRETVNRHHHFHHRELRAVTSIEAFLKVRGLFIFSRGRRGD